MTSRNQRELRLIDGQVVRSRRVELRHSQRSLAAALGVTQQVIYRLEHGMRQNELDVSFIVDLAHALGVDPAQLFIDHESPAPGAGDQCGEDDLKAVGAVFASTGDWLFVDDLADALSWTIERTLVAVADLEPRLRVLGQRLAWANDREVRLCGDSANAPQVAAVTERAVRSWGLAEADAHTVFTLVSGGKARHRLSLMSVRRLVRAALVSVDVIDGGKQDDEPRLTAEAEYNLCLAELGLTGSSGRQSS